MYEDIDQIANVAAAKEMDLVEWARGSGAMRRGRAVERFQHEDWMPHSPTGGD